MNTLKGKFTREMSRIIKQLTLVLLFLIAVKLSAQTNKVDSLKTAYEIAKGEEKITTGINLYRLTYRGDVPYAKELIQELKREVKKAGYEKYIGKIDVNLGTSKMTQGEYDSAIYYFNKSLKYFAQVKDSIGLSDAYLNLGNCQDDMGDFANSLESYLMSYKISEQANIVSTLASATSNIGTIYAQQERFDKALEYFRISLPNQRKSKNISGEGNVINNIGLCYASVNNADSALPYFEKALVIWRSVGDLAGEAMTLHNLSGVYGKQGNYGKSEEMLLKSYAICKQINMVYGVVQNLGHLTDLYIDTKRYDKALYAVNESIDLATKSKLLPSLVPLYSKRAKVHFLNMDFKEAYRSLEQHLLLKDSLMSEENSKVIIEMESKYELEKKDKEILKQELQFNKQTVVLKEREFQRNAFIGGFVVMLLMGILIFRGYKQKQKANIIITAQKEEVERQREIANQQKEEAEHQKEIVEEKNQEILDSINYAKRLQDAILPPLKLVKESLNNSFILYKPKDIVAGDFYWMETIQCANVPISQLANSPSQNQLILFAAADCTGHGVPGAMVSVVCSNALNRVVKEFHIYEPGKILDKVTDLVIETFEKSEAEVKDGMDISLCSIKYLVSGIKTSENAKVGNRKSEISNSKCKAILQWAGANNPLWVVRANQTPSGVEKCEEKDFSTLRPCSVTASLEITTLGDSHISHLTSQFSLQEIKADKQPIGKYAERTPFATHTIELSEGDSIYIFSDGYADQFGGEKGKKFKSTKMKELILSIQHESMDRQRQLINEAFETWKGNIEQIDDVCVIGVRI